MSSPWGAIFHIQLQHLWAGQCHSHLAVTLFISDDTSTYITPLDLPRHPWGGPTNVTILPIFYRKMKTFPHFQVWHCFFWACKPSRGKVSIKITYPSLPKAEGVARNIKLCRLGQLRRKFTVRITFPAQKDKWHVGTEMTRKSVLSLHDHLECLTYAAFLQLLFDSADFLRTYHGRQPVTPYTQLLSSMFTIVI